MFKPEQPLSFIYGIIRRLLLCQFIVRTEHVDDFVLPYATILQEYR